MDSKAVLEQVSDKTAGSARSGDTVRGLFLDLSTTALLLAALLYSVFDLAPKVSGKAAPTSIVPLLLSTLLPMATVALLAVIERLFTPAGPRKSLRSWFLHLHITIFWFFVASLTFACTTAAIGALAHHIGFEPGLIDLRFADGKDLLVLFGALWLSMIAGDFFFYWYHRSMHRSRILWQIHKVHHTDRELEAITINRDGWLDAIVAAVLIAAPTNLVLKLQSLDAWEMGWVTGIIVAVFTTFLTVGHMNLRFQVGRMSRIYCSPQMHRIHHSSLPQHWDKNYAFVFPMWDVLFGTYYAPLRDDFPPTGVEGEDEIKSFWHAQAFPVLQWKKMYREWRERRIAASLSASTEPQEVPIESGKTYWWCTCGRSKRQPFCDGSHQGTSFLPLKFRPVNTGTVRLCVCKKTNKPPFCGDQRRLCTLLAESRRDSTTRTSASAGGG